jgi:hypothetical protein
MRFRNGAMRGGLPKRASPNTCGANLEIYAQFLRKMHLLCQGDIGHIAQQDNTISRLQSKI